MNRVAHLTLLLVLLLQSACTNLFLYPDQKIYYTPQVANLEYCNLSIPTADDECLHAWFLPAVGESKGSVLFLHGNAGNVSTHLAGVHWLPARGYNVLLVDYRGFGESDGAATVVNAHKDAEAALAYLVRHGEKPIYIFGQSFGASVAITLGAYSSYRDDISAIVADSAFSTYRSIATEKLDSAWLTWPFSGLLVKTISDRYSALDSVAKVSPIPILFSHAKDDEVVLSHHTELLFQRALEPKSMLISAGNQHISCFQLEPNRDALVRFLEEHQQR